MNPQTIRNIPIRNLNSILAYAWDIDPSKLSLLLDSTELDDTDNWPMLLMISYLTHSCERLIRQGLSREYREFSEITPAVRGRLDWKTSLSRGLHKRGQLSCVQSLLDPETPTNQLIATALVLSMNCLPSNKGLYQKLRGLRVHMGRVRTLPIQDALNVNEGDVRFNPYYKAAAIASRLILAGAISGQTFGEQAKSFKLNNERILYQIFEAFVRNFAKRELSDRAQVREKRKIDWLTDAIEPSIYPLPSLNADLIIDRRLSKDNFETVVIDVKCYAQTLIEYRNREILRPSHVHQIFTYLSNVKTKTLGTKKRGILLYPKVTQEIDTKKHLLDIVIEARTLDLSDDWASIKEALVAILCGV